MKQDTFLKIVGIIIIVAMVGSMLAAGFLYAPTESTDTPSITDQQTDKSSFDYDISFDTNIIDNLTSIRVAAQTNVLDMDHRTLIKKLGFINIEMEQDRSMFYGKGKLII